MMDSKSTPIEWLNTLKKTLDMIKSKINGKNSLSGDAFETVMNILKETRDKEKNVWWAGNGGSAAICSHLSQDLINKLNIKSYFCGENTLMSCMANDYGYEQVYCRPLEVLSSKDDVMIAISSSGNSENILSCARLAHEKQLKLITLSGFNQNNKLWNMKAKASFFIPSQLYGQVEICHEAILHALIESLWLNKKR